MNVHKNGDMRHRGPTKNKKRSKRLNEKQKSCNFLRRQDFFFVFLVCRLVVEGFLSGDRVFKIECHISFGSICGLFATIMGGNDFMYRLWVKKTLYFDLCGKICFSWAVLVMVSE